MIKRLSVSIAAAVSLLGLGVASPAQAAAPVLSFTRVQANPPGRDDRSNDSLNYEWVRLTNNTARTINLKGWTVQDRANHKFTFTSWNLGPGKGLLLRSGKGGNNLNGHHWQRSHYVWNNDGDTAYLRSPGGKLIDVCWYTAKQVNDSGYVSC